MREEFYNSRLFNGIGREDAEALDLQIEEHELAQGEVLFREGERGSGFYIVGSGTLRISKGEGDESETINMLEAGEVIGEMSVIDGQPRSATASAETDCLLGKIGEEGFALLATASPEITRNFVRTLVQRLRVTGDRLAESLLLAERTSLIGKMTNMIVHDLRNPVQNVLLAAEYCGTPDQAEDLQRLATTLEKSANRMMRMLQELLDFSKGKPQLELSTRRASELVATLDEEIFARLANKGIEIRKDIRYGGEFRADFERLLRVVINIIRNADEAMGGRGTITLSIAEEGGNLLVDISDTGKGIPEESLAKIFEPFFSEGKSDGTGLGMSMAKKLVESHGGTISITSELGVGTTFHLSLPLDGEAAEAAAGSLKE